MTRTSLQGVDHSRIREIKTDPEAKDELRGYTTILPS